MLTGTGGIKAVEISVRTHSNLAANAPDFSGWPDIGRVYCC